MPGIMEVCQKCKTKHFYTDDAATFAISRYDKTLKICNDCGTVEALDHLLHAKRRLPP